MQRNEKDAIWQLVFAALKEEIDEWQVNLWFGTITAEEIDDTKAILRLDNLLMRNMVKDRYFPLLEKCFANIFGHPVPVTLIGEDTRRKDIPLPNDPPAQPEKKGAGAPRSLPGRQEYTFENFVVGSSNKLAYAACLAVTETVIAGPENDDFDMYNPLFVYGESGLGKTHLMYSIKNKIEKEHPEVKLIYIKGEEFLNEMIASIASNRSEEFREKFRQADILIIDDIQFIANRTGLQEEVFHTFNYLYENNKQIVFTSDKPPKDINPLESRLRSRFEQGMMADIQPPDIELRMAIIKQKSKQLDIEVPYEVVTYMADRLKTNIRQVEGALRKTAAVSFLTGQPITVETARKAIADFLTESEPQNVLIDRIFNTVSLKFHVPVEELKGKAQTVEIVNPRNEAIYLLRTLTDLSTVEIGKLFNRSHTTILHSVSKVEGMIKNYAAYEEEISELIADIKG
ncbi:MAG: chromosomal replication initiator protein DnaA [Clostridia bacterium]|nr:chromosomal replication initiator protein DnaA [Clostridia bacterium]